MATAVRAPSATTPSPVTVTVVDRALYEQALADVRALRPYGTYRPPVDDRLPPTADPKCGSRSGYDAHRQRREHACSRCLDANAGRSVVDSTLASDHTWRHT